MAKEISSFEHWSCIVQRGHVDEIDVTYLCKYIIAVSYLTMNDGQYSLDSMTA